MLHLRLQRLRIALLFVLVMGAGAELVAQEGDERYTEQLWTANVYPETYEFEQAVAFESTQDYQKAFWCYLNLFPVDPDSAITSSRRLAKNYSEPEPELRNAFAIYAKDDPEMQDKSASGEEVRKRKARWLDEITACLDDVFFKSRRPYHLNNSGLKRYDRGDLHGAIMAFQQAVDIDPKPKYLYNLGYVRHQVGQYQGAITCFNASIEHGHRLSEAYYYRGFCKGKLGDKGEALKDFNAAILIDPSYVEPLLTRGFERFKVGAYDLALEDLNHVLELDPDNADGYLSRGFVHHRLGNRDQACSDWHQAYDLGIKRVQGVLGKHCSTN